MSPPLTLRDFLQYVLPALLAACMFVPLVAPADRVSVEGLIFGSVVLSYLIWQPTYRLAQLFYEYFPPTRTRTKNAFKTSKQTFDKWAWGADKLRYLMSSEDREYYYSHGSFAALYAVAGLYLFVYAALNLFFLIRAAVSDDTFSRLAMSAASAFAAAAANLDAPAAPAAVGAARRVLTAATPSVVNFQMNTLVLFVASAVLCYFAYRQYHLYYDLLFKAGGQYDLLAEKYLNDPRNVWGQVKYHEGPEQGNLFRDAVVTLRKKDGKTILDTTKADVRGRFQLTDKSSECWTAGCQIHVDIKGTEAGKDRPKTLYFTEFKFRKDQVAYAELRIPKPS